MSIKKKVLLAGQQNCGKSTIFNMLTGARQHVANYPGVTVDKKSGYFSHNNINYHLVDLPGTYSLTSFSLEERVARNALNEEAPDAVINVLDAANIARSLHLTLQMIEMGLPMVLVLNMMDVAQKQGMQIDHTKLGQALNIPTIQAIGRLKKGIKEICDDLPDARPSTLSVDYPALESTISEIIAQLNLAQVQTQFTTRWFAVRLLENDSEVYQQLSEQLSDEHYVLLTDFIEKQRNEMAKEITIGISDYIVAQRQTQVSQLIAECVSYPDEQNQRKNITNIIDNLVLNRFAAPFFLIATVFVIYQGAIVYGYELTNYWWPYLASLREIIASILPDAGFLHDPYVRSLGLWVVDSANTLLNYIPIFVILFAMIAVLEDSGYMARIAFISDKILHKFGLHGQSTLPMILAGVFAGGCAVPGVMATKGIPDNRARLATILTVPYMNCLAKVPLYTLLMGIFFTESKSLMTFYISTFSIIAALLVAKLLTTTVLQKTETAPFVMELPRYNLPTLRSIITRSLERTWVYIRKVGTIVLAVSTIIFVLLQFPGVPEEDMAQFQTRAEQSINKFNKSIASTRFAQSVNNDNLTDLVNFYNDYKRAKLNAGSADASQQVNDNFEARSSLYFSISSPAKGDKEARTAWSALRKLTSERSTIRREMKELSLEASLLGQFGRSIEPVTRFAGFDWKINVALFSSFAARESSVATLGVLFQQDEDTNQKLEDRMGNSSELANQGQVVAVALILFFILYPPCLATVMMIKVQTGEYKWMVLSIALPTLLGFIVATLAFSLGKYFDLSGIQVMSAVYFTALALLFLLGLRRSPNQLQQIGDIPIKNL